MMRRVLLPALILLAAGTPANAEPTEIVVRVISEDAKFIGDSMGGANVVLRVAKTGRVLARGKTSGGTGNTALIMQAKGRSPLISTPDAAAFVTQVDINEPTLIDLEVTGPNARPGSQIRIVSQRWVMPGQPVNTGDGWVVELPGLSISPSASAVSGGVADGTRAFTISAKVELLCGCPITPGGMWDAKDYQVTASIWQHGRRVSEFPLQFIEAPGGFAGRITLPAKGRYRVFVMARNVVTGNSGITELPLQR
jgi:hypothetical protein